MSIAACYNQIRKYEKLKQNIQKIIASLNDFDNSNDKTIHELKEIYLVNGDNTPVYDRCISLKGQANKTSNYLNNNIIPAIDSAINELYRTIARLEAEAEEARAKEKAAVETKGKTLIAKEK
ncbi:MAG: hypothetical protein GX758_02565 [Tenericutes bacterium]|nr:hypothetical protein [Mycoplasmatota bacterium]